MRSLTPLHVSERVRISNDTFIRCIGQVVHVASRSDLAGIVAAPDVGNARSMLAEWGVEQLALIEYCNADGENVAFFALRDGDGRWSDLHGNNFTIKSAADVPIVKSRRTPRESSAKSLEIGRSGKAKGRRAHKKKVLETYSGPERRTARRYPIELGFSYRITTQRLRPLRKGKSLNMSRWGILMTGDDGLAPRTPVEIVVEWPAKAIPQMPVRLRMRGRVVRVQKDEVTTIAVKFRRYDFVRDA